MLIFHIRTLGAGSPVGLDGINFSQSGLSLIGIIGSACLGGFSGQLICYNIELFSIYEELF